MVGTLGKIIQVVGALGKIIHVDTRGGIQRLVEGRTAWWREAKGSENIDYRVAWVVVAPRLYWMLKERTQHVRSLPRHSRLLPGGCLGANDESIQQQEGNPDSFWGGGTDASSGHKSVLSALGCPV